MPSRLARACSSQFPLFSQNGQKWLPSTKSISTMRRRCAFISGVSFSTSMPPATGMVQALVTLPFTLTEQTLQWPPGSELRVRAEARDPDAGRIGGLHDGLTGLGHHVLPVDHQLDALHDRASLSALGRPASISAPASACARSSTGSYGRLLSFSS